MPTFRTLAAALLFTLPLVPLPAPAAAPKVLHMFLSTSEAGLDPAVGSDLASLSLLENVTRQNLDTVAGEADNALNVRLTRVQRVVENDQITPVDIIRPQLVFVLINEDALLIGQSGHHAGAFDFYGLVNENDQDDGHRHRNGHIAQ